MPPMLKIATWNVNSVTARLERLLSFLDRHSPDVVALQELKCVEEKFPFEAIQNAGYRSAVYGQKTYNGVALLSKEKPKDVVNGFGESFTDPAARLIAATYSGVRVISAYCPNGQEVGSEKYQHKLDWFRHLKEYLARNHRPDEKICLGGDFNVAPEDRDVWDPEAWRGKILFSDPERKALSELCQFGFTDTFRKHHPEGKLYSWWDYRQLAFPFNKGLRIDFLLATESLTEVCIQTAIDREERKGEKPSDHAPVLAVFDV